MSGKRKFTHEQRLQAVNLVLEEHKSKKEVARTFDTNVSVIKKWIKYYENFGVEGLIVSNGSYTGKFKIDVVEYMHQNHLSMRQTAEHFKIPEHSTVSKWERIFYEEGPQALMEERRGRGKNMSSKGNKKNEKPPEIEKDLIAEVQRLRMENEYLKKLNALIQEREKSKNPTR